MADENGVVISDEMLESIAGGVLDDVSKSNLHAIVHGCKVNGMSYEATLKLLDYLRHSSDADEIFALIDTYWNE